MRLGADMPGSPVVCTCAGLGVTAGAWHAQRRLASTHVNTQRLHYFHFGSEKKLGSHRRLSKETQCSVFEWFRGGAKEVAQQADEPDVVDEDDLPFPLSILENTHLRGRQLALAYRATENGWSALQFHKHCNMKGPCVVYAVTSTGARFGGFNSEGFKSSDDYSPSSKAFLFCWPKSAAEPVLLSKVGGTEAALFDYARGGPQWGADALVIGPPQAPVMGGIAGPDSQTLGAGDLHTAKSRLGLAYERLPKSLKQTSLFGGSDKAATLTEVEVYFSPDIAALY